MKLESGFWGGTIADRWNVRYQGPRGLSYSVVYFNPNLHTQNQGNIIFSFTLSMESPRSSYRKHDSQSIPGYQLSLDYYSSPNPQHTLRNTRALSVFVNRP